MRTRLLTVGLARETDIVEVRQRTRQTASVLGFDKQDQTRITTAVSEIARNAWEYAGGGRVEYWLAGDEVPRLEIVVCDRGKGIPELDAVLAGAFRSSTGLGLGIVGARRLMDAFEIETEAGRGTTVRMAKPLARRVGRRDLADLTQALAVQEALDPVAEIRRQNQEMMVQLEEQHHRQQELIQLNQELQETNRGVVALYAELDERADHLRRADELKSRFLSNMSHEFRTPLNSIVALSRLLLSQSDGALSAEQERQVQYIRKAAENLTELVNDLLDLAKVAAGKTVVAAAEFSAADLFGALRGMLRPLLLSDAVALVFEDAADLPPLFADEGKVSQILRNFLSNAIKFTPAGEIRVWGDYDRASDCVTFSVRDTGIGIAPKQIDIIWQEFGQIENPLQKSLKGTGLGLPLSKKLAELLGGGVAVESAPGQGSVFRLTVPRVYAKTAQDGEIEAKWVLEPGRLPVLVVEDDAADAFVIERALAETRYQVLTVRSSAQALRALGDRLPAAIILDILLVGEESWGFLMEIRERTATERIPVIVVSSTQEERKARSLGADDYLSKPIAPVTLVAALNRATGGDSVTKVLMVDDEEVSRYLVRQLLPRGAYELNEAATAADGIQQLRAAPPDVVLLDLMMPNIDGFEFLDRLSEDAEASAIPAVVLTSAALTTEERLRLDHAAEIMSKSDLSAETLVAAIRRAVASREARFP